MESPSAAESSQSAVGILLSTIADRNLSSDILENGTGPDIEDGVKQLQHVRLDRENIVSISGEILPLLPNITNLYLQQNRIESLLPLASATNLRFLTVAGNKLTSTRGLEKLTKLLFLDVSDNLIASLNPGADLPTGLSFLDLRNNPCCSDLTLTKQVCEALPDLRTLNGQNLDEESELDDDGPSVHSGGAHHLGEEDLESPGADGGLTAESREMIQRSRKRVEQDREDSLETISELRHLQANTAVRLKELQLQTGEQSGKQQPSSSSEHS
ncbi:hypothetical protein KFL_006510070 [Klebsormidium nitens]|uniref:Uncharacterized protein n=1 Tax=Klebsormidium nitens TaxID=105231 RepID=A0A1Y1IIJ2_KLENI|nr:hypothetical protein KFL_006510070 [Klebsormidium nitens]|eukprot:GAQ90523.1 hypothetical protein KFL_006510070 [Klebsormidium nitens]